MDVSQAKKQLRAELSQRRREFDSREANERIIAQAVELATGTGQVAAYIPYGNEPGGENFVEALAGVVDVLWLPRSLQQGVLEWARFEGAESLRRGAYGILEPAGEAHDSSVLASCDLIFVPALALSPTGIRLGKGAGYYDRALPHAPAARTVGVIYRHELIDAVPHEPHDAPLDGYIAG